MPSIQRVGLRYILVVSAAGLSVACSSSSSPPSSVDAGGEPETSVTTDAETTGTDADNTVMDAGNSNPPEAGAALSCSAYCTAVMAACTGGHAQYVSNDACLNACAHIPLGTAADTSGNTLGCRAYHAMLAASTPAPHCWHAGPYGYGACGDECESFCTLATTWCTPAGGFDGGAPPYADDTACKTSCAGYKQIDSADGGLGLDGGYNAQGPASGNTLDCREYHLGASFAGGAMQALHCQHPGANSPTCTP